MGNTIPRRRQPCAAPGASRPSDFAVFSAARARELAAEKPPAHLRGEELGRWYVSQAAALTVHAETMAGEIERLAGAR